MVAFEGLRKSMQPIKRILIRFLSLALLFLFVLPPSSGLAHAVVINSDPPDGAVLAESPKEIVLEFDEVLEPQFSKVKIVDPNFKTVVPGPGVVDPVSLKVIRLEIPEPLPPGVYSASWDARSVVDGHYTDGAVSFTVGESSSSAPSMLPAVGTLLPGTEFPPLLDTLLRWLRYIFLALATGGPVFAVLVWRPAYRHWSTANWIDDEEAGDSLRLVSQVGWIGLLFVGEIFLLFQAWQLAQGDDFLASFWRAIWGLLSPASGWPFWVRLLLIGIALLLTSRLSLPGSGAPLLWWGEVGVAAITLLTLSLQSHGAALGSRLAISLDFIHLGAMAVWLGGLLPLFLLLRTTNLPPALLVPRFSRLAISSVALLGLSGLYNLYIEVGGLEALVSTRYGQALMVKLVFFSFLILLGAINLLLLSPSLLGDRLRAVKRMGRTIRLELLFGSIVLLATSLMTGIIPAQKAIQVQRRMGYIGSYKQDGTRLSLWVAPARVGDNEIAVDVSGWPKASADSSSEVILRFQVVDKSVSATQVTAATQDGRRYSVRGSYLSLAGDWSIDVILRQPGFNDIRHQFTVRVGAAGANSAIGIMLQRSPGLP
jgi:copper transport protein